MVGKDKVDCFNGSVLFKASALGVFSESCPFPFALLSNGVDQGVKLTPDRGVNGRAGRRGGPGRLIFHLKSGRLGDNRISDSPPAPVPCYRKGKTSLRRNQRGVKLCFPRQPGFVARSHSSGNQRRRSRCALAQSTSLPPRRQQSISPRALAPAVVRDFRGGNRSRHERALTRPSAFLSLLFSPPPLYLFFTLSAERRE